MFEIEFVLFCLHHNHDFSALDKEKSQLFQDFVKATHQQGWTQKQAQNLEKDAKKAMERERAAKTHISSLEKSLSKERERGQKYKVAFENFKASAIKKRKESLMSDRKLKAQLSMKDAFIEKACAKLVLFKDRLAQFEVAVFQEFVVLVSPQIEVSINAVHSLHFLIIFLFISFIEFHLMNSI